MCVIAHACLRGWRRLASHSFYFLIFAFFVSALSASLFSFQSIHTDTDIHTHTDTHPHNTKHVRRPHSALGVAFVLFVYRTSARTHIRTQRVTHLHPSLFSPSPSLPPPQHSSHEPQRQKEGGAVDARGRHASLPLFVAVVSSPLDPADLPTTPSSHEHRPPAATWASFPFSKR